MYLTDVKIKNFRGYGENNAREDKCYVYSSLDSQIVVFHGFNGFGKTSFFEAIEWCLTDNVYRLNKFYDDDTYLVNELKKSHYLKFYHPLDGAKRNRVIHVELQFSNGLKIIRSSTSSVLKTTDKDKGYSSNVSMGYDEQLEIVNNEKVLREFIKETKDKDTFFNTHMLGQESISDFLRNNSPHKRREIFLQLLQEEQLASTLQRLKKLKAPNNKVSNKLKQLDTELTSNNNFKTGISLFFAKLGFENELQYLDAIKIAFQPILDLPENKLSENFKLSLLSDREISLKNMAEMFENLMIVKQNVINEQTTLTTQYNELTRIHEGRKKLALLIKAEEMLKLSLHAQLLKTSNAGEIRQELLKIVEAKKLLSERIKTVTDKKNEIIKYESLFSSNINNLDFKNRVVKDVFWTVYNNDRNSLSKFNEEFAEQLLLLGEQFSFINIITELELHEIKSREELYQNDKKRLLEDLENNSNTKKGLTDLNTEYQNLLNTVKEYIVTNEADIKECPVCLNSNFSDERYQELLEGWEEDTTVAIKLMSIIDLTFAKGNKEIDNISSKENEILEKINRLNDDYEKEILYKLKSEIEAVKQVFNEQYNLILNRLNNDINDANDNNRKLSIRNSDLVRSLTSVTESIRVLFNEEDIKESKNAELDRYIVDYKDWLQKNQNAIGMLHEPTLSDLQLEIRSLKSQESLIVQEDDLLFDKIQTNVEDKALADQLLHSLNEILKYNIPTEFAKLLNSYKELDEKIKDLDRHNNILNVSKKYIDETYDTLFDKQNRIIKKRLENHPIISWVYESINPHPFHKKLHITNNDRGTNFIGQTQLDDKIDLYLDQIFSAAQLNILALSIFLGLGLTQSYSKLDQLFLDDPIQSMDDVNILAFIDVLRAIMDSSRYGHRKLIVSTHDENFAQLLSIKMRNKKTVQYHIIGYTEEGPIISQR